MTDKEAMKLALEALELMYACYAHPKWISHKQQEEKILAQCVATTMTLRQAIEQAEKQEPVALEWDEVYDAAAAAYCRSEASRKALRLCFQSRDQATQISIGWTAKELMAFAKTVAYLYTHPQPKREPLTVQQIIDLADKFDWHKDCAVKFARAIEAAHGIKGEA